MPEHQVHWTALPRSADASHVELDVFVSPRLGTDALVPEYVLGDFPEFETWTKRVADGEVAFAVSFDGGAPVPATIVTQGSLDEDLWAHLFPSDSLVLPWSFRDLSTRPIRSFPVRWIVAYLRDIYAKAGASGARLPEFDDLDRLDEDLGDILDTRVPEEYNPATEVPGPGAGQPPKQPQGCLTSIFAPFCRLLRRFCRWLRKLLGLSGGGSPGPGAPSGPAKPAPSSVEFHYRPPGPRPTDPYKEIEDQIAAYGVVQPVPLEGADMATALANYPVSFAFTQARRFYDRTEELKAPPPPPESEPRWDFHRRVGGLGDYPTLMRQLGLVIRIRVPRPATAPDAVRVAPSVGGAVRPGVDIAPETACTLSEDRFLARPYTDSDLAGGMLDLEGVDDRLADPTGAFDLVQVDADGTALKAIVTAASLRRRRQLILAVLGFTTAESKAEPEPLPSTRSAGIAIVRANRATGLKQRLARTQAHWVGQGAETLHADEVVRGYQVWVKHEGKWHSLCKRKGVYRLVDDDGTLVDERKIDDHGYIKRSGATSKDRSSDLYVHEALVRWTGWSLVAPPPGKTVVLGTRVDPETGETVPAEQGEAMVSRAGEGLRLETRFAPAPESLPRLRFGGSYRFALAWVDLAGQPLAQLEEGPDGLGAEARVSEEIVFRRFEPVSPPSVLPFGEYTPGGSLERLVVRSDYDRDPAEWLADVDPGPSYAEVDGRRLFAPKTSQLMAEMHGCFEGAFGPLGDAAAAFKLAEREQGTFEHPDPTVSFGEPEKLADDTVVNHDLHSTLVAPYLPDPIAAGVLLRGVPNLTLAGVSGEPLDVVEVPDVEGPVLRIPFAGAWPDVESVRIRVSGSNPGAAPHWNGSKRLLTIHLPKGAEVGVLYSCYLDSGELKKMGAWDWIDDHDPGGKLRTQAQQSVHWLLAPWRTLALVHAVQRPLLPPELQPGAIATRARNETFSTITATAKVDNSAGRVDLEARWEDWRDDVPQTAEFVKKPHSAVVGHWTHEPGTAMPPQRQEFGDTRHRRVTYRLKAASRFREYLPVGAGLELTREGSTQSVSVPASAAPDPPRISYAVPAFGWRQDVGPGGDVALGPGETMTRTRLGGGLRVFIQRSWYSSGEGERLAVVLQGPDPIRETPVSRIGIDPTVGEMPWPENVELKPAMFTDADTYPAVMLSERQAKVAIASFAPSFDKGRKLWACDITLDMNALPWGDWPFVRLALARHQPEAIEGAHLSKVVLAQWAQLAPDRRLTVTRSATDTVTVELRGRGRAKPEANRVVIGIEHAPGAVPDELEWRPAGGGAAPELGVALWDGAIKPQPDGEDLLWRAEDVPIPPHTVGDSVRLTVRELERRPGEGEVGRGAYRITYADAVRLA